MSELTANSSPAPVKDENENKNTPVSIKNVKIVIENQVENKRPINDASMKKIP